MSLSNCRAERAAAHRELQRVASGIPSVEAADRIQPADSPDGVHETELVVEKTRRGTLPNSVGWAIVRSGLGMHEVRGGNHPNYKRVTVR